MFEQELDNRLVQALNKLGFEDPTPIQAKGIPLALEEKKDIVAKARTGSGKTLAYLIPIIQTILASNLQGNCALIIVPSRELCDQVSKVISSLLVFTARAVAHVNIGQQTTDKIRASLLSETPQIIVGTPSTILKQMEHNNISREINFLVFDEADLLMTYGYEDDLKQLHNLLAPGAQAWLMSATLGDDCDSLKDMFCTKPVSLRLQESNESQLVQYYVKCSEFDKFLLAYVIFKLGLLKGKTIIFVNDIDRCYRLKLFLEQFGIKSAALNSELPVASRLHIVDQFNRNVFQLLIATDDSHKDSASKASTDYGISRGVDFKGVSCVLNFDLPVSSKGYVHRVGRTARANRSGFSLSFVVPSEEFGKHKIATVSTARRDEKTLERILKSQENQVLPYNFDMKQVENFRYRCEDAFRAVTKVAVRESRIKELKNEILASEKLQRHFEENPEDMNALRHDVPLHPTRVQSELKHVPSYLLPNSVQTHKPLFEDKNKVHKFRKHKPGKKTKGRKGQKHDPLKRFKR